MIKVIYVILYVMSLIINFIYFLITINSIAYVSKNLETLFS